MSNAVSRPRRRGTPQLQDSAAKLVHHIRTRVLHTPGSRAALRRAVGYQLGDPRTFLALRYVAAFFPDRADEATEGAFLAVAAMMCAQPRQSRDQDVHAGTAPTADPETDPTAVQAQLDTVELDSPQATPNEAGKTSPPRATSLGATLAFAVNHNIVSGSAAERRLHLLCRGDSAEAHRQLPRVLSLVRESQITVDWVTLICDLTLWDDQRYRIAADWVRDFYRSLNTIPDLDLPTLTDSEDTP